LLWALGLGTLELMGYKACRIFQDETVMANRIYGYKRGENGEYTDRVESFYERYGAELQNFPMKRIRYGTKQTEVVDHYDPVALTHLTAEQEAIITRFIKKNNK